MGRPKQLIDLGGATMVEHVVRALEREVDEVFLLGDGPVTTSLAGYSRVADAGDCRGPMAGVLGAMRAEPDACWVMTACDLPRLRTGAVQWLVSMRRAGVWVVFPSIDGFAEPLLALYEPPARLLLERAAAAGGYSLHRFARNPRAILAEPPAAFTDCWSNANTLRELDRLLVRGSS